MYLYSKTEEEIKAMRNSLLKKGIDTQFTDMHDCSSLKEFQEYNCDCLNARKVSPRAFEIPADVSLEVHDLDRIIQSIKECI